MSVERVREYMPHFDPVDVDSESLLAKAIDFGIKDRENEYEELITSLMNRLNKANVRDLARQKGLL